MDEQQLNEELALLNEAIHAIYTGAQGYSIGKRQVTKADLNALLAERRRILSDLAELTSCGGRSLASWPGR